MRKIPQQKRAKIVVDSILEATEQGVRKYGIQDLTTPKIAELAGISVGSLYQYFEDKAQIFDLLIEQKSHALGQQLQQQVLQQHHQNLQELIKLTIKFGFEQMHDDFIRQVIVYAHQLSAHLSIDVIQHYFFELSQNVLADYYQVIKTEQLRTRIFVIINSTIYTMLRFIQSEPNLISEEELTDQLCEMVSNYLMK